MKTTNSMPQNNVRIAPQPLFQLQTSVESFCFQML